VTLSAVERNRLLDQGVIICLRCEEAKTVDNFSESDTATGYNSRCRRCASDDRLRYHLEGVYGITVEEFRQMERDQDGVCAICGNGPSTQPRLGVRLDPKTKKLQALLCTNCNHGLGKFHHDPELLRRAADLLES
jgi:hypothetical protein